jgi:hypothetical protein
VIFVYNRQGKHPSEVATFYDDLALVHHSSLEKYYSME